jgi:2-succinyl-6-hydroxy-2,4-cyclohexadiene-1-carboxylate synthase
MKKIIALHGFLGLPDDWSLLGKKAWQTPDLWEASRRLQTRGPDKAFTAWTDDFIADFTADLNKSAKRNAEPSVLLGYSLGGRLAMHVAIARPDLFCGLVLVSANPGLARREERDARLIHDQVWAQRFRQEPWAEVIGNWNGQAVLAPPPDQAKDFIALKRAESAFDREILAQSLTAWSLGAQADLRERLRNLPIPVLLLSGEHDVKFTSLQRELAFGSPLQHQIIPQAGHRVPWDHPKAFLQAVHKFVQSVESLEG